jgi:hypothetical protein
MMCVCMHVCKGWCVYACMYPKDGVEIPWYLVRYDRTEMTRRRPRIPEIVVAKDIQYSVLLPVGASSFFLHTSNQKFKTPRLRFFC